MKRVLLFSFIALSIALAPAVKAFRAPARAPLPNFDKREKLARTKITPGQSEAADRLKLRIHGAQVDIDPITGSPKFVASPHGFLSGPEGRGRGISPQFRQGIPDQDPHAAVKAFLNEHSALFGHGAEVLDSAIISREYTTPHNG